MFWTRWIYKTKPLSVAEAALELLESAEPRTLDVHNGKLISSNVGLSLEITGGL